MGTLEKRLGLREPSKPDKRGAGHPFGEAFTLLEKGHTGDFNAELAELAARYRKPLEVIANMPPGVNVPEAEAELNLVLNTLGHELLGLLPPGDLEDVPSEEVIIAPGTDNKRRGLRGLSQGRKLGTTSAPDKSPRLKRKRKGKAQPPDAPGLPSKSAPVVEDASEKPGLFTRIIPIDDEDIFGDPESDEGLFENRRFPTVTIDGRQIPILGSPDDDLDPDHDRIFKPDTTALKRQSVARSMAVAMASSLLGIDVDPDELTDATEPDPKSLWSAKADLHIAADVISPTPLADRWDSAMEVLSTGDPVTTTPDETLFAGIVQRTYPPADTSSLNPATHALIVVKDFARDKSIGKAVESAKQILELMLMRYKEKTAKELALLISEQKDPAVMARDEAMIKTLIASDEDFFDKWGVSPSHETLVESLRIVDDATGLLRTRQPVVRVDIPVLETKEIVPGNIHRSLAAAVAAVAALLPSQAGHLLDSGTSKPKPSAKTQSVAGVPKESVAQKVPDKDVRALPVNDPGAYGSGDKTHCEGPPISFEGVEKKLIPVSTPDLKTGRPGDCVKAPRYIVIHTTASPEPTAEGIYEYFASGAGGRGVASQFVIGNDGHTIQMGETLASQADRMYHAAYNNDGSIGIEITAKDIYNSKSEAPTAQYKQTLALVRALMKLYNIPIADPQHNSTWRAPSNKFDDPPPGVYGHYQLNPVNPDSRTDPGEGFFKDLINDLQSPESVQPPATGPEHIPAIKEHLTPPNLDSNENSQINIPWLSKSILKYKDKIISESEKNDISPEFVAIIMAIESGGDSSEVSTANAKGVLQIIPSTAASIAKELGMVTYDLHNPDDNIKMGVHYLGQLKKLFGKESHGPSWDETIRLVSAGYNGGPGAANNMRDGIYTNNAGPFQETKTYAAMAVEMWQNRHNPNYKSPR